MSVSVYEKRRQADREAEKREQEENRKVTTALSGQRCPEREDVIKNLRRMDKNDNS